MNDSEVNEIVDKIIENLESSLDKLGQNLRIKEVQEKVVDVVEVTKKRPIAEATEDSTVEEGELVPPKIPFASVRYPTPDNILTIQKTYSKPVNESSSYIPIPQIQVPKTQISTSPKKPVITTPILVEEIEQLEKEETIEEYTSLDEVETDLETFFLDIPKGVRLIHLYGPPGAGKTTLGLQTAIEIAPKNTYYFITSHATSIIKRVKQIIYHARWNEYLSFKHAFFPIEISNLEVLEVHLEKIENMSSDEVGLVIIDHLTDYSRGQIHKEERRKQLRELLERLYILADEKDCKILIINGYSYKDSAPAEDIVESFCDMTLHMIVEDNCVKLIAEEEEFPLILDDSGVRNLHVNVYY